MTTWELVDTSEDKVISTFDADSIKWQGSKSGIPYVIGLTPNGVTSAGIQQHNVVAVVPLTPNRFVRKSNGGNNQ